MQMQDKEIDNLKKRVNAWKTPGKKGTQKRRKLGLTQGGGSLEVITLLVRDAFYFIHKFTHMH